MQRFYYPSPLTSIWSSGYDPRLPRRRSWVRIPARTLKPASSFWVVVSYLPSLKSDVNLCVREHSQSCTCIIAFGNKLFITNRFIVYKIHFVHPCATFSSLIPLPRIVPISVRRCTCSIRGLSARNPQKIFHNRPRMHEKSICLYIIPERGRSALSPPVSYV